MRRTHTAGEKCFVDYCGPTAPLINPKTGEIRTVQVFAAVLSASNYTYAEAIWTLELQNWLLSRVRTFEFFNGAPDYVPGHIIRVYGEGAKTKSSLSLAGTPLVPLNRSPFAY